MCGVTETGDLPKGRDEKWGQKGEVETPRRERGTGTERVEDSHKHSHKHRDTGRRGGSYSQGQEHRGFRDTQSEGVGDRGDRWLTPAIPALGRLRGKDDHEFQDSLGYPDVRARGRQR